MNTDDHDAAEWFAANPPGLTAALATRRVLIAGAGGLGSNVAALLARAGIGGLILIDFDVVSPSNLNRQFYFRDQVGMSKVAALTVNLRRIAPDLACSGHAVRLAPENCNALVPKEVDVLCECLDGAPAKAMFAGFCRRERAHLPLICVSGLAGLGPIETMAVQDRGGGFHLIGDGLSEMTPELGTVSARVMAAAALQAHLAIRLLWASHQAS